MKRIAVTLASVAVTASLALTASPVSALGLKRDPGTRTRLRSRPHDPDTDAEGLRDGFEVHRTGSSPRRADSDGDGFRDGHEDGDHDGILDEGEDHDRSGFVGTVVVYDEQDRELVLELAVGYPILLTLPTDVKIRMAAGCEVTPSESLLREGLDVVELYLRDGMRRGTRVVDGIALGCPEDWV